MKTILLIILQSIIWIVISQETQAMCVGDIDQSCKTIFLTSSHCIFFDPTKDAKARILLPDPVKACDHLNENWSKRCQADHQKFIDSGYGLLVEGTVRDAASLPCGYNKNGQPQKFFYHTKNPDDCSLFRSEVKIHVSYPCCDTPNVGACFFGDDTFSIESVEVTEKSSKITTEPIERR